MRLLNTIIESLTLTEQEVLPSEEEKIFQGLGNLIFSKLELVFSTLCSLIQ